MKWIMVGLIKEEVHLIDVGPGRGSASLKMCRIRLFLRDGLAGENELELGRFIKVVTLCRGGIFSFRFKWVG